MIKMYKEALGVTKTGIVLGIGATVVGRAGGNTAGLQTLGNYQGVMANVKGAGLTLKSLKKLRL